MASAVSKMHRNRVAGKCVHGNHVIIFRRLRLHRKPRVAMRDLNLCPRFPQVSKYILRNDLNARINLIKTKHVSRLAVGRQRSGSQANIGHTARPALAAVVQRQPHSRIARVISSGQPPQLVTGHELCPVLDRPMNQRAIPSRVFGLFIGNAQRPVKTSHLHNCVFSIGALLKHNHNQQPDRGRGPEKAPGPVLPPHQRRRQRGGIHQAPRHFIASAKHQRRQHAYKH